MTLTVTFNVLTLQVLNITFEAGLPLSFLNWAYVCQGVYFEAYVTLGVLIFSVFVHMPSIPIFSVILDHRILGVLVKFSGV